MCKDRLVVIAFAHVGRNPNMELVVIVLGAYFLPTIISIARKNNQALTVFVINLFFGWTFLGWVIALAMGCQAPARVDVRIIEDRRNDRRW
jgi:hypothetical protein